FNDEDVPLFIDAEPLRSEPQGFAPEQMVRCDACLRANPPTRTSCLYCAASLPASEANAALQVPTLRKLEKWEQGFNVILWPGQAQGRADETLQTMAQLLRLNVEDIKRLLEAGEALPVARASTPDEAALIERKLNEMSVKVFLLADQELGLEESATQRARALELTESALLFYPAGGGEASCVSWNELSLLVSGRLFVREIEVEERKGRKAEQEIVDARELSADEAVLDIYTAQGNAAWRIRSGNFDFSCLGARKHLVAAQNFSTLVEILRVRATEAVFDDSYNRVRRELAIAWPLEQQTESRGWNRKRPGQVSTESVTRSDNELQFTRHSRLRRYLQQHRLEVNV
ncbi:MAG TPA: hypothetical protein VF766_10335, partial [Pyrinomonadaceae bacterium]